APARKTLDDLMTVHGLAQEHRSVFGDDETGEVCIDPPRPRLPPPDTSPVDYRIVGAKVGPRQLAQIWDDQEKARRAALNERIAAANDAMFKRECERAGIDPAMGVSPALAASLAKSVEI